MHRTTTTATLLITVAVAALTGCVTVQRPPAAVPPTAPSGGSLPRPDGSAGPQAVQAPAREALDRVGTPPAQAPAPSPATRPRVPAAPEQQAAPRSPDRSLPHRAPAPPHRLAPPPRRAPVPHPVPGHAGVCGLGEQYGRWHPDSPAAKICGQTYGR
ncbi:hypothetical protein ABZ858_09595 [Streptomyces sp. NPDC047017]|uniref:hypothetical protein n=1 Tax=Streptomyces sp. NPDC047017 TaxID=3155024 RepID=UPI0033DBFC8D